MTLEDIPKNNLTEKPYKVHSLGRNASHYPPSSDQIWMYRCSRVMPVSLLETLKIDE